MIDTVRAVLSEFALPHGFDDEKWEHKQTDVVNFAKETSYFHEGARLRVEQFDPALKHVRIFHSFTKESLTVEVSIPRVAAWGEHNVSMVAPDWIGWAVQLIDALVAWGLSDFWGAPLSVVPSIMDWRTQRADLMVNYLPRVAPVVDAKRVLVGLQPTRRLKAIRFGNDTLVIHNGGKRRRREIAVYDKELEVRKKGGTLQARELAAGVLRVEVRLRGQEQIRADFGLTEDGPCLRDVLKPEAIRAVLLKNLGLLDVAEGMESVNVSFGELKARVGARRAMAILQRREFLTGASDAEVAALADVQQSTVRKWIRQDRQLGLFKATVSAEGVLEDLIAQIHEATDFRTAEATTQTSEASPTPSGEGGREMTS